MTDEPAEVTEGACKGGPTIPLTDAGDRMLLECVRCGLVVPHGNWNNASGFKAGCLGENHADA